jgi:polynucleotide 5'-kinase involved in rRNA processing
MHDGPATVEALLITGTVGVGKTTTARVIGEQLQKLGIPHAVIDPRGGSLKCRSAAA